jgi:germination protein M
LGGPAECGRAIAVIHFRRPADNLGIMSKGPKASLGCLFWIAVFLLAVVLFIFNQNNIMQFIKRFQNNDGKNPAFPTVVESSPGKKSPSPATGPEGDGHIGLTLPTPSPSSSSDKPKPEAREASPSPSPSPRPSPSSAPAKGSIRNSKLYFLVRKENDVIDLAGVNRQIIHEDAPLTQTLAVLLKGPTANEKRSSLVSLIPSGTRLEDVYVKGDTAYISFNQEFRYNDFGVPGLKAQLKQVVYTATEFPNIEKVQILIDGKKVDYLAQEGVYIGAPLTRASF